MSAWAETVDFSILQGQTISAITGLEEESENIFDIVTISTEEGHTYQLFHEQECCEVVCLVDVNGDPQDLLNTPILLAEVDTKEQEESDPDDWGESGTWTFYKLRTVKGSVTLRWLGTSNGYYSEDVEMKEIT